MSDDLVKRLHSLATAFGIHAPEEQIKYLAAFLETGTETLEQWVKEAANEIERLTVGYVAREMAEEKARAATKRAEAVEAEVARLREALEFYADPGNYFAVMIMGDPPCGAFADDVSDTGEEYGWRHGKRARQALAQQEQSNG